jgi:nucleoid DNA-binding protein
MHRKRVLIKKIVAKRNKYNYLAVREIYDDIFDIFEDLLQQGETIYIQNFGKFFTKEEKSRVINSVFTNEPVTCPAFIAPKFKCSRTFKNRLNEQKNINKRRKAMKQKELAEEAKKAKKAAKKD